MLAVYLSHPIGPSDGEDEKIARLDNIAHANEWMRFLVARTRGWAIICPVIGYAGALDMDTHAPKALTFQKEWLERSDLVVQVGGWMSPHMLTDRNWASRATIPVLDLMFWGQRPPWHIETASKILESQYALVASSVRRRAPWLPPLSEADVVALREAEEVLVAEPKHEDALAIVRQILNATMRLDPPAVATPPPRMK